MKRIAVVLAAAATLGAPAVAEAHTLTYARAKAFAQDRANDLTAQTAGYGTRLNYCFRTSAHRFRCVARWSYNDPARYQGCNTEPGACTPIAGIRHCDADIVVRFRSSRSGRIVAITDGRRCV